MISRLLSLVRNRVSDRPTTSADIVGQEGLGQTVAAVAQQVSALEKSMNFQFSSLSSAITLAAEQIRREGELEMKRTNTLLEENRTKSDMRTEALRGEVDAHMERILCEMSAMETTLRREQLAQQAANEKAGAIIIAKYDNALGAMESSLRSEINYVGVTAQERESRIAAVKDTHWEEHRRSHDQDKEAIRVAQVGIDHRLDNLNHLNARIESMSSGFPSKEAVDKATGNIESRVDRGEQDTRLRFERMDGKLNTLEKEMGIELRREARPGQDMKTSQGAIIAAVAFAVTILGAMILLANFVTSGP